MQLLSGNNMKKKTWLIKRNPEINNNVNKTKEKGIQWYTETNANPINSFRRPSGCTSKKDDEVYIYQKDYGIWAKGKILEGGEKKENFHEFTTLRDVVNFSQTKAKYKNNTFWGKVILEKLGKKKDGEFRFIVFEAKLELETLEREISIHEQEITTTQAPWSTLRTSIEDLKVKKGELSTTIPPSMRHKLLTKYSMLHHHGTVLDIDHHVPKSIGGPGNIEENLVPLPASANRYKGAKIPEGLFEVAKDYEQLFNKNEFKFFKDKERKKLKDYKNEEYPFLWGEEVKDEAKRIVNKINNELEFEEAKNFYKKVRSKVYGANL